MHAIGSPICLGIASAGLVSYIRDEEFEVDVYLPFPLVVTVASVLPQAALLAYGVWVRATDVAHPGTVDAAPLAAHWPDYVGVMAENIPQLLLQTLVFAVGWADVPTRTYILSAVGSYGGIIYTGFYMRTMAELRQAEINRQALLQQQQQLSSSQTPPGIGHASGVEIAVRA